MLSLAPARGARPLHGRLGSDGGLVKLLCTEQMIDQEKLREGERMAMPLISRLVVGILPKVCQRGRPRGIEMIQDTPL